VKAKYDAENAEDFPVQLVGDGVEGGAWNLSLDEAAGLGEALLAIVETVKSIRLNAEVTEAA